MTHFLPAGTAFVLVIGAGVLHGLASNRWSDVVPGPATGNVADAPRTAGSWGGHDQATDSQQLARGGIHAACSRRYEHRITRAKLQMLLVYGPTGPISAHTPDICYPGAGYELVGAPTRQVLPPHGEAPAAAFWTAKARKEEPGRVLYLRLLWAWNAADGWEAPDYPRLAFCHVPMLYKLYIVQEMNSPDEALLNDDCADFLRHLLPQLGPSLFHARG